MIELKHVCKTFESGTGGVDALKDVSLTIEDGDVYGIIGMSGAGKSTLVRGLLNLIRPLSGTVTSVLLSVAVLTLYVFFYHRIFAVTFDEPFARATGTRASLYNLLLALLTAVTVVLGMRMMGTLLISSLIIFPALSAMRLCRRYRSVILCSAAVSVLCFLCGMVLSYGLETPTGASIVCVNLAVFLLLWLVSRFRRR